MRKARSRRRRNQATADLNITAFMNLMVVLVPFLLITAVFSGVTILELNLPLMESNAQEDRVPELEIEVIIRKEEVIIADSRGGVIKAIPQFRGEHNVKALSETLQTIKSRLPNKTSAIILSEPDISYETLVKVIDAVRSYRTQQDGEWILAELFPEISIGDAPQRVN